MTIFHAFIGGGAWPADEVQQMSDVAKEMAARIIFHHDPHKEAHHTRVFTSQGPGADLHPLGSGTEFIRTF